MARGWRIEDSVEWFHKSPSSRIKACLRFTIQLLARDSEADRAVSVTWSAPFHLRCFAKANHKKGRQENCMWSGHFITHSTCVWLRGIKHIFLKPSEPRKGKMLLLKNFFHDVFSLWWFQHLNTYKKTWSAWNEEVFLVLFQEVSRKNFVITEP